jgi:hypothetical protein
MDRVTQVRSTMAAVGRAPARQQDPARQDVERRLAHYFSSFGLTDPQRLDHLIGDVLADVPFRQANDADAALKAAETHVAAWFAQVLGVAGDAAATVVAGRAAFLLCNGPARWQRAFLRNPPPKAFFAAMQRATVEPTPTPAPCAMPPQELEFWSVADLLQCWRNRPARVTFGSLLSLMHWR